jgi:glucose dehydrogenase
LSGFNALSEWFCRVILTVFTAMNDKKVAFVMAGVLIVVAVHAVGEQVRRIDDTALKNAASTGDEWLSTGLSPDESLYSPLKEITTSKVSRVAFQWSYVVGSGGWAQEATRLFANGTLYGITNWSVVFAVYARTGKEKMEMESGGKSTRVASEDLLCADILRRKTQKRGVM